MSKRTGKWALYPLLTAILLTFGYAPAQSAGPKPPSLTTLAAYQHQKLNWHSCDTGNQCATFQVPVDYHVLNGQSFTLAVTRHQANDKKDRLGILLVNPGGPGVSATDYASNASLIVSPTLMKYYDVAGFDGRGIARSQSVSCLTPTQEDGFLSSPSTVATRADLNIQIKAAKYLADRCAVATGNRLGHFSTLETAEDMDLLRSILGESQLNFLGKSYGTYLGTLYSALYPNRVGKFVLDGAVDPNEGIGLQNQQQAVAFDQALQDYLKRNPNFTAKQITKFLADLRNYPILTSSHRYLTQSLAVLGVAASLYDSANGWPALHDALNLAITNHSGDALLNLSDQYTGRVGSTPQTGSYTNKNDSAFLISCLDFPETRDMQQIEKDATTIAQAAPIFGPYLAYANLACRYWHASPPRMPSLSTIRTPGQILVIGNTKDPATPYRWAEALHGILANSTLLTFNSDGHTAQNRGNACIDNLVDQYFTIKHWHAPSQNPSCNA